MEIILQDGTYACSCRETLHRVFDHTSNRVSRKQHTLSSIVHQRDMRRVACKLIGHHTSRSVGQRLQESLEVCVVKQGPAAARRP